jgi:hypothetical protein
MITLPAPGIYQGEGEIEQAELGSLIPFVLTWEFFPPEVDLQEALQIIHLKGGDTPLENRLFFYENGEILLINSILGEAKGKWMKGEKHLSWEVNAPPLFEGFEVIRLEGDGLFHFHAEYLSSHSRNEIRGKFSAASSPRNTPSC